MSDFKQVVNEVTRNLEGELTTAKKTSIFENSKKYIILQDILTTVTSKLAKDETICDYLPLTNGGNSASFSTGWLGMGYTTKKNAQTYVKHFKDTRGNRLLIFTTERIIFLTPLDFLETGHFISYPYEAIGGIMLKKNKPGLFKKNPVCFYLDFQANEHIFTEVISATEEEKLRKMKRNIPKFDAIPITKKIVRTNKFDYLFSNTSLVVKIGYLFNIFWLALFVYVLYQVIKVSRYF